MLPARTGLSQLSVGPDSPRMTVTPFNLEAIIAGLLDSSHLKGLGNVIGRWALRQVSEQVGLSGAVRAWARPSQGFELVIRLVTVGPGQYQLIANHIPELGYHRASA